MRHGHPSPHVAVPWSVLLHRTAEVPSSNRGPEMSQPTDFMVLTGSLPANAKTVTQIWPDSFHQHFTKSICSSHHNTPCCTAWDSDNITRIVWGLGNAAPVCATHSKSRYMEMVSFAQQNSNWYPRNRKLGGPQSPSGRFGDDTDLFTLPHPKPQFFGCPVCGLATVADSQTRLQKGRAIPLQAWTGPEGSRRLMIPDFKTIGTWRW